MSNQYHGLVFYVRFTQKNKHIKEKIEKRAKDDCISVNQLVIHLCEQHILNETTPFADCKMD